MHPRDAAAELLARREARGSFLGYARYMQPDNEQPQLHHQLICQVLDEVEKGNEDRVMLFLPPGSAKSTYGSTLFPQYFLGRNPGLTVLGASHTQDLANRFSRRVRNGIATQRFADLFPNVKIASDISGVSSWETSQQGEYKPVGIGGPIAGRRGDLLIIDDPVKSRAEADSEVNRETVWQWWLNDARTRLKPGGRVVLIMTRWHEDDLAGRLLINEPGRWKVIKVPFMALKDDVLGRKPGERLWPEWFTEQMMLDAQSDPRSWTSLYQQDPRPPEGAEFRRSWISRYKHWPKQSNKILLVDPSAGRSAKSDFTSMWVIALGTDHNAYIVDGIRARINLTTRAENLFRLHQKWKPLQVRYEEYGMQADIEHIKSEMETRDYRFKIHAVGGATMKENRIRRLIPWFENGKIWFPENGLMRARPPVMGLDANGAPKVLAEGGEEDIIASFIEQEYAAFPVGKYDDAFDNLARLAEPELSLPWPKFVKPNEEASVLWGVIDSVTGY